MLKLKFCQKNEVNKAIEIMCKSGEWDERKRNYLGQNWKEVVNTFEAIVDSKGKLGIILVLKNKKRVVGVLPLVRIGGNTLLFGCSGILEKHLKEGDFLLERKLFEIIPSSYQTLLAYTRPTSLQWLPFPLRSLKMKNMEELQKNWPSLPKVFQKSINIYGPLDYYEVLLSKITSPYFLIKKEVKYPRNNQSPLPFRHEPFNEKENFKEITDRYKQFGIELYRKIFSNPMAKTVCFAGSLGLSGSGYTDSCLILPINPSVNLSSIFKGIKDFYRQKNKRQFFILVPSGHSVIGKNINFIKSLWQIYYNIPLNRRWRKNFFKNLVDSRVSGGRKLLKEPDYDSNLSNPSFPKNPINRRYLSF